MLALRCPECSSRLEHAPHRRLHVCDGCSRRWIAGGHEHGGLRELTSTLVRPTLSPRPGEALHLLPVWSVERVEPGRTSLYVPAIGWSRMSLLLAFARRLSEGEVEWGPWTDAPPLPLSPGDVHVEEAFELAEIVCRALDSQVDVDAEGEMPFGGIRLLDWPCVRRSSQIVELVRGRATSQRLADSLRSGRHDPLSVDGAPPSETR